MLPEPDQAKVRIGIRWHTGATDELRVARAIHPGTARRSPSPAVEMIRRLGPVTPAAELAAQLNAAGLTTGNGRPFDVKAVQWIRHAYRIPAPAAYADGEISVTEAASRLGCSTTVIYHWIHTGQLTARRSSGGRLCIPWDDQVQARCQELIAQSARLGRTARPRTLPAPPSPAADGRGQRHRSRLPARLQHPCHLLLDRHRQARRPPRPGRPAAHPLERPGSGRMPRPDRAIRPPQPGGPQDQAPPAALSSPGMSVPAGISDNISAAPWPAPIARNQIQPSTRLQEGQYEVTVPNTADRVAQTAAAMLLEEKLEPVFHRDSYGYRPGRSAHDALAVCRRRCWKQGLGTRP